MSAFRKRVLRAVRRPVVAMGLTAALVITAGFQARPGNDYFEIAKNLDIFAHVLREIHLNFVDEVEPNQFVRTGIDAMLGELDPYTVYYSAAEVESYRLENTGQSGPGLRVGLREGHIIITTITSGTPADEAGLAPGDRILTVDGTVVEGEITDPEIVDALLRGQPGSRFAVTVQRFEASEPEEVILMRKDVQGSNVPYYGFVEEHVGYVALSIFMQGATRDVRNALEELRAQDPNLKAFVLDLRGNPGGLLLEAIGISNLFVPQGEVIVENKGRMPGVSRVFTAPQPAYDTETPIIVLVDENSASASEIVAGVVQDLDRGVVIGRRSFGKGLVQTTRPLSYNAQIKLTTARYHTPSGRCIQAIDYSSRGEDGSPVRAGTDQQQQFVTRRGRPVLDAGGIEPEIKIEQPQRHPLVEDLLGQHLIFDYASHYKRLHESIGPATDFEVTDAIYQDFLAYLNKRGYSYASPSQQLVTQLNKQLATEGLADELKPQLRHIQNTLEQGTDELLRANKAVLVRLLEREIVDRYYQQRGRLLSSFNDDAFILAAIKLANEPTRYKEILSVR